MRCEMHPVRYAPHITTQPQHYLLFFVRRLRIGQSTPSAGRECDFRIMMIGMVVWMNCKLNPHIRGDIMLKKDMKAYVGRRDPDDLCNCTNTPSCLDLATCHASICVTLFAPPRRHGLEFAEAVSDLVRMLRRYAPHQCPTLTLSLLKSSHYSDTRPWAPRYKSLVSIKAKRLCPKISLSHFQLLSSSPITRQHHIISITSISCSPRACTR